MKTPLILSVAAAAVLSVGLQADETSERMAAMEAQIEALQEELSALKANDAEASDEAADEEEEDEGESVNERLDDMEESISELSRNTSGNHLKFGVDFRTEYDYISYKMAAKDQTGEDTHTNDGLFSNRLWLNMKWAATNNISFTGQLAYNKTYGARFYNPMTTNPQFETFDWIPNENPYDDTVRVRSAYFFYMNRTFLGVKMPWTFSIGRRPSTNGHLVNLRDDDHAASPMGHNINVEFDGLSAKFSFEQLTDIEGMYVKFCAGRGGTNADGKFAPAPFASDNTSNIDLAGFIFVPYDDGQYAIGTQYYYANNLIDAKYDANMAFQGMEDVGSMQAVTANFTIHGIGDGINDFLDDTIFFASGAWSFTNPDKDGQGMLGTTDSKMGSSYWVGTQFPSLITDSGRWGLEWNHGDKYWRSITYGEDTLVGSKLAARGNAFEAYMTEYLIGRTFSAQLRYTYIDYDYTGSNGFFGSTTGAAVKIDDVANHPMYGPMTVDTAQDLRLYLRYRF